eukprot:290065-Rhodomonas_salina.1
MYGEICDHTRQARSGHTCKGRYRLVPDPTRVGPEQRNALPALHALGQYRTSRTKSVAAYARP